jgi:hypothetical protein
MLQKTEQSFHSIWWNKICWMRMANDVLQWLHLNKTEIQTPLVNIIIIISHFQLTIAHWLCTHFWYSTWQQVLWLHDATTMLQPCCSNKIFHFKSYINPTSWMDTMPQTIWLQLQFAPGLPDKLYIHQTWLSILSLPGNEARRNTDCTCYTYRKRFVISGAIVYWRIHWRSIDWNKGSHHVKHCIVALVRNTRMHKPTTLHTIAAWQCA